MMLRRVATATALIALTTFASIAADSEENACLSKEAQREAVASRKAVPLAQAMRTIGPKNKGEVVSARLCHTPKGLVYVLTLLARNGKVSRATVDAENGNLVGGG